MDVEALSFATDDFIEELGLTAKGDIFALKAFCQRHTIASTSTPVIDVKKTDFEERKRKLLEQLEIGKSKKKVKSNEKSSSSCTSTNTGVKTRKISLGWLNYSERQKRFVPVRQINGGKSRRLSVATNANKQDIIEEGKKLFFPDGMSPQGYATAFIFDLANFKGNTIEDETKDGEKTDPFTMQAYIEKSKLSQVRLYLTTRLIVSDDEEDQESEQSEDDVEYVSTYTKKDTKVESDDDADLLYSVFDDKLSQLIGPSGEREKIREEQDKAFNDSLEEDRRKQQEKEKEQKEQKRLEEVRLARLERVPPEPSKEHPQVKIAVKHVFLGKTVRSFPVKETMVAVYDWIGSMAPNPENFILCQCKGQATLATDPVESFQIAHSTWKYVINQYQSAKKIQK